MWSANMKTAISCVPGVSEQVRCRNREGRSSLLLPGCELNTVRSVISPSGPRVAGARGSRQQHRQVPLARTASGGGG
jgi:hypothetical protein